MERVPKGSVHCSEAKPQNDPRCPRDQAAGMQLVPLVRMLRWGQTDWDALGNKQEVRSGDSGTGLIKAAGDKSQVSTLPHPGPPGWGGFVAGGLLALLSVPGLMGSQPWAAEAAVMPFHLSRAAQGKVR